MSDQKASEVEDLEHIYADASKGPVQISYGVLNSITKSFSQVIGHGASSVVYLGDLKNGKVAVKKVSQTVMNLSDIRFLEEVKCLKRVKHQNIVRFLGYCAESHGVAMEIDGKFRLAEVPQRLLCFEYVPNGTLHDYLHQEKTYGFEWNIRYQIIKGICAGLHYLHQGRICHLDLKPGNVLLGTHMEPKITDFGLSRCIDEQSTIDTIHIFGTPGYIAPELINNQKISFKSDIFSLGKIMDRLLIGSNGSTTEDWHEGLNTDCQQMKRCIDVAKHCVEDNPSKRPTIADIVLKLNETDSCRPLKDYYIPDYILKPDSEQVTFDSVPLCPVVVFINSRSGGQLGSSLIKTYRELLNEAQVFDLSEEAPDKVLHRLYCNFEKLKSNGDLVATQIQRSLRLIVAGGDGTASWLLGVVSDLKLSHPPPVATVPLGTENNLPFSFGWGKKNPATDQAAVKSFLGQVKRAGEMKIDSWHIIMRMRIAEEVQCDHIAPLDLPHSLHAFRHVSACEYLNLEGYHTFRGGFWNYFSMGLDAQVSYEFHSERKRNQEKFRPQLRNQSTYAKFGFSHLLRQPSSWNIAQLAEVKIMKRPGGLWEELEIPCSVQSVVCLNLPSFSGGLNPWGIPSTRNIRDRELTAPFVDDGLIEVVGFGNAWHRLKLLAPNGHGTRLAQAHRIRFEFQKGAAEHTFMRIDGEPWKQPLPKDDDTVVIEISNFRQVAMLTNGPCRSKSIMDPFSPSCHSNSLEDEDDSNNLEDEDEWEHGDP